MTESEFFASLDDSQPQESLAQILQRFPELFAATTQGCARIPALDWRRDIPRNYTLEQAREDALKALRELAASLPGAQAVQAVEVLEEDLFATLDDQGYGGRDIRVRCQLVPGIACPVTAPA